MSAVSDLRFKFAVDAILKNWTALQMAVAQAAAGPESANIASWMSDATVQWFSENKDLAPYEVEEFLLDIINQYFNVLIEDGSAQDISQLICKFYTIASDIKGTSDEDFRNSLQSSLPKCDLSVFKVSAEEPEDVSAESESDLAQNMQELTFREEEETQQKNKEPIVDDDGFTMVTRKKKW